MYLRSVLAAVLAGGLVLLLQPAHAATETRQGSGVLTEVVAYRCTTTGSAETQDIKVTVTLTMPTTATAGQQLSIGWQGAYAEDTGLKAPATGLTAGTSLYAYASISEFAGLTSATGVGTLTPVAANQVIPLPTTTVSMKTTPSSAGTGTVKPAALNFGTTPTAPSIKCEVQNKDALTTYTLTVTADGSEADPSPSASASPKPTITVTATVTSSPAEDETETETEPDTDTKAGGNGKIDKTPKGAASTGGGGDQGPDGRIFLLTGSLLILAAAAGGLLLRRRAWA